MQEEKQMKLEGVCFDQDRTFVGMFDIPNVGTCVGRLYYNVNRRLELRIYSDKLEFPECDEVIARLSDENEKMYLAVFRNCRFDLAGFSPAGREHIAHFKDAVFSRKRFFGFPQDNFKTVNIYLNSWGEFCFPQSSKKHAEYKPIMHSFRLNNKIKVSFNQDIAGYFLSEPNIFNDLFVNWKLTENEIKDLGAKLAKILIPLSDKIGIKNSHKHKWFIRIENIPKKLTVDIVSYYIESLLKCLTYDFGTEVVKTELVSHDVFDSEKGITIPIKFDYIYYRRLMLKKIKYSFGRDPFNFHSFNRNEWRVMLNNLFSKNNILEPFFDILIQNHLENCLTEYHLERYIDCIAAIGMNKKYGNLKYQKAFEDFVMNLDQEMKKQILSLFKKGLRNIKINNKNNKKDWAVVGHKLSGLRAMTTHFNGTSNRVDMSKYLPIYSILELIVIDYIFEILEISIDKRLTYKEKYLSKIIRGYAK